MKFLDVKTDFAFKKVFGSAHSTEVLIDFLNAIVYSESPKKITSLNIVDPYTVPKLQGMKDTFVDVKAKLNDGTQVIIEMQVLNHAGFEKRVLYNAAKNYAQQLKTGEDYTLLNPVIALTILDFNMFEADDLAPKSNPHLSRFKLLETQTLTEYNGDMELVFVELPKFKTSDQDLLTLQDKWVYFIKNAGDLNHIPEVMEDSPALKQAFEMINEAGMSQEELELQHKHKDFIMIQRTSLSKAKADGKEEATLAIARCMKLDNMDIQIIARLTGLTPEAIAKL
jgi:predicted transposase/invertase (TIGR01784 family)